MRSCRIVLSLLCSAVMVSSAYQVSWAQLPSPPLPSLSPSNAVENGDDDGVEVYTRGTLHEAFAIPASNDVVVPPVVQKEPPAVIDEIPPEQEPEGDNVTWISGYWAYDDDLNDYIWISGLWRDVPPGRQWIPGYWAQTPEGYQWVSGMWNEVESTTLAYLPPPPATLERGPQIETPGPDYFYVPGCWEFRTGRYGWRPGYWAPRQRDWIWVPAHYVHTPYGCCFVPGHWDYALIDRGLCYAPVRFVHARPAVAYRPVIVIDTWDTLVMHLWVDPHRGCYAYGNYYEAPRNRYVPWHEYRGPSGRGDPLFTYYEWRNGPEYRQRLSGWHTHFVSHRDWRPPTTYREQVRYVESRRSTTNVNINLNFAIDVRKIDRDRDRDVRLPVPLKHVSRDKETHYREQAKSWAMASQSRRQIEAEKVGRPPEGPKDRPQEPRRATIELPKAVAAVGRKDLPKLETPDKLKDVKPDKPRGEEVRIPSRTREQRVAQEQAQNRSRPDSKRGEGDTPSNVPAPPPKREPGEQASKEDKDAKPDKDKKKPDARDAFGIDSPGRGPAREGGKPTRDADRPEMRRDDSPRNGEERPNVTKPDRSPSNDRPMPKPGRTESPNRAENPGRSENPGRPEKMDREESSKSDSVPRRVETPSGKPPRPDAAATPENRPPSRRPPEAKEAAPGKTDGPPSPTKADPTPAMERRDSRDPSTIPRPLDNTPSMNRRPERQADPKPSAPGNRLPSNPSTERRQNPPSAGNPPAANSTVEPGRRSGNPAPRASDSKGARPRANPDRKGTSPRPDPKVREKAQERLKEREKEKEKKESEKKPD